MNPRDIVDTLLESDDPHSRKSFTLVYRPYKTGDSWRWFWVLHPDDKKRAAAHGDASSRHQAAIEARLKARSLNGQVSSVKLEK